jgi:hypothetical protein
MQDASDWMLNLWRIPGDVFRTIVAIYSVAGFLLASLAALAVGRYAKMNRRTR